nr:immunoglobulin light chain junction region [Macaca mulatta]
YCQALEYPLTF